MSSPAARAACNVEEFADGHIGLPGTVMLAGAAHLLGWDIPRCLVYSGCSLVDAGRLCMVNAARILGSLLPRYGINQGLMKFTAVP